MGFMERAMEGREWISNWIGEEWIGLIILGLLYIYMSLRERKSKTKKAEELSNRRKWNEEQLLLQEEEKKQLLAKKRSIQSSEFKGEYNIIETNKKRKENIEYKDKKQEFKAQESKKNIETLKFKFIFSQNELIRSIIMIDILGKPKGLRE